jgi:putative tryptophan/tyrosine transport system substrate-binding protein
MKRRPLLLGGSAFLLPRLATAQTPSPRRIGAMMFLAQDHPEAQQRTDALRRRLEELGWIEGGNLHIDYRWVAPDLAGAEAMAAELLAAHPDVVISTGTAATRSLLKASQTIPVVFVLVVDPVVDGIVPNLAHPGGNVTGFSSFDASMGGKWLQVLKQCAPGVSRVAALANPDMLPAEIFQHAIEPAAQPLALDVVFSPVRSLADIDKVVSAFAQQPNGGLVVLPDAFTVPNGQAILEAATRNKLPAVYPYRFFANSGGLVSYGIDVPDLFRRSAEYVDRILRGTKAGDLPVQNPTKFELVVNLKTAKALGITVPASLLASADDVIE